MSLALAELRRSTRSLHTRTEGAVGADLILSGTLSPAEFDVLLRNHFYIYQQLEPSLHAAAAALDPELHALLPQLRPALRRACHARQIELPDFTDWPDPELDLGPAGAYGVAYVLLGSHLGGKVLYRALQRMPQLTANGGLDFHAALAALPPGHWRRFLLLLEERIQEPTAVRTAVDQAKAVFDFFYRVFTFQPAG